MAHRNIYKHSISLRKIRIRNHEREQFAAALREVKYRGYEVEEISDGRRIVITKPGGKRAYGSIGKEDFIVFIYTPSEKRLWAITHNQIKKDLVAKGKQNKRQTLVILRALKKVYDGAEPDEALRDVKSINLVGETPEAILKAYKWIWGQEDVNYPTGKGRAMSWEGWKKEKGKWERTGDGLFDIMNLLKGKRASRQTVK